MADEEFKAIIVGKWALGHHREKGLTLLRFDFTDREPLVLAIPNDEADKIAEAMTQQSVLRTKPLQKH